MKQINFNRDWKFAHDSELEAYNDFGLRKYSEGKGAADRFYDYSNWQSVNLPHDWAIALPKCPDADRFSGARATTHHHRYANERHSDVKDVYNVGWYRKQFAYDNTWQGKRVFIHFEGVYHDAVIWCNGVYLDRHLSGYTGFTIELTDHLVPGEDNSIAVRVDTEQGEGWWYEGAGIYRNVYLFVSEPTYFQFGKTVVRADVDGHVSARALLVNDSENALNEVAEWQICDAAGKVVAKASTPFALAPYSEVELSAELTVDAPLLWHVDHPTLYTLHIRAVDEVSECFGFRSAVFDSEQGFLLNGEVLKLRGACVHQDLGGVGVALTDNLQYYKIRMLKEMGVNAYRCSHHAPSPVLLRACDELGMLVMDETRMFGTSPEALRQLTDLVERDRNHPSIIIWAIANEEFSVQNLPWSARLTEKVGRILKGLDPTRPFCCASNNGPNDTGLNKAAEVRGINYIHGAPPNPISWVDDYHRAHPDQPIVGSEEGSNVLSRGDVVNDLASGRLTSTGELTMLWGSTPRCWVTFFETRPYLAGAFMWTGFDYHGEPNPFYHANYSSSFGLIDLCGIPKPAFYYHRAWWTGRGVLKIGPHWNYDEKGKRVTVTVYTNCQEVTLYCNGRKVGTQQVERFGLPKWELNYEPGELVAVGKRGNEVLRDVLRTAGKVASLRTVTVLPCESEEDVGIVQIEALDAAGNPCPLAADTVELTLGQGRIVGVCNGDPADRYDEQQSDDVLTRDIPMFTAEDGSIYSVAPKAPNAFSRQRDFIKTEEATDPNEPEMRIIAAFDHVVIPPQKYTYTVRLRDVQEFEYVEFERFSGAAWVSLNGEEIGNNVRISRDDTMRISRPYRFPCSFREGENELTVTVMLKNGERFPFTGYVRLGRHVSKPWRVPLHFGLSRVFVKTAQPQTLTARLCKE